MTEPLNIHCFMYVPWEGPGVIADWAGELVEETRYFKKNQEVMFQFLDYPGSLAGR
ncbi:MAG: hypothetical protein ABFS10_15715 [Bacteroidota bacterium]